MTNPDLLTELSEWFLKHCNGEWEHQGGIKINTLDNPGWIARMTLRGTRLENAPFSPIKINNGDDDWFECSINDCIFTGAGDLSKINTILQIFLDFANRL